jgi:hypothetical protein
MSNEKDQEDKGGEKNSLTFISGVGLRINAWTFTLIACIFIVDTIGVRGYET